VPPAEVAPAANAAPLVIQAAVLPPPAPVAPPQPPAVRTDIAVACPTRVKPEVPSRAIKEGVEGTVRAQVVIRDGAVVKVDIFSGPPIYRAAVRDAMLRYQCLSGPGDVLATQEFNFKFE
jgi:protein TonB